MEGPDHSRSTPELHAPRAFPRRQFLAAATASFAALIAGCTAGGKDERSSKDVGKGQGGVAPGEGSQDSERYRQSLEHLYSPVFDHEAIENTGKLTPTPFNGPAEGVDFSRGLPIDY